MRETFHYDEDLDEYFYKADSDVNVKWKPSIYMPRSASRILLEITNVRVERLNECTFSDAQAEGWPSRELSGEPNRLDPINWYKRTWESINGTGSWNLNPWVWVIQFEVISK